MRKYLFLMLLAVLLTIYRSDYAQAAPQKNPISYGQQTVMTGSASLAVVLQVPKSQTAAIPLIHFSSSQPAYALNHLKGEFGERLMDSCFTNRLLKSTGGWSRVTPAQIGRTGIDGLYLKLDRNGIPRDLLISDAKYGSALLGMTRNGLQMSNSWINPRILQTSQKYRKLALDMENKKLLSVSGTVKNRAVNRVTIPMNNKTNVEIWSNRNGIQYFCTDKNISSADIHKQLIRTADYLKGAADGKIGYRSRLFSYKPNGNEHQFVISKLDVNGKVISRQTISGEFAKLPKEYQKIIESNVRRFLLSIGKSRETTKALTSEICNNPEQFNRLCIQQRGSIFAGLDGRAFKTAGILAIFGMGVDAFSQYFENGTINVKRTATMGGLTFVSTIAGNYAGTQASILLSYNSPLLGQVGGRFIGGSVASVLIAGGLWATGNTDSKTAGKIAASGIAISGITSLAYAAPQIVMWYATTYGVTSGGVAIASLHGAAQTSAGLAWLGGGSLVAGGGGTAAGTTFLAAVSWLGPAALAITGAYATYTVYRYFKSDADQYRYISEIVRLTQKRVNEGKQIEWQTVN